MEVYILNVARFFFMYVFAKSLLLLKLYFILLCLSSIEGGLGHKTVFVAVFARKKTEDYYSL